MWWLALRVADALERGQEPGRGIDHLEPDAGGGHEIALDLLGLAGPQQPVVDEHAGQLVAHRALHQRRGDRRVDATGQPAQHVPVADLRADPGDLLLDDVERGPRRPAARALEQEPLEHLPPVLGVQHLGVELHAVERPARVLERRHRRDARRRRDREAGRGLRDRVPVRHPHRLLGGQPVEEHAGVDDGEGRTPVLGGPRTRHGPAQRGGHRLEAVADAEGRYPRVEEARGDLRGAGRVDAGRAAGQDHGLGTARADLLRRDGVRNDLGVDAALAHPAGDELRVLRAEVDDQHHVVGQGLDRSGSRHPREASGVRVRR